MVEHFNTDGELIARIRAGLQPKGTAPDAPVVLHLGGARFMKPDFIEECLHDLTMSALLEDMSPLKRLAVHILLDSAYIELPKKDGDE